MGVAQGTAIPHETAKPVPRLQLAAEALLQRPGQARPNPPDGGLIVGLIVGLMAVKAIQTAL